MDLPFRCGRKRTIEIATGTGRNTEGKMKAFNATMEHLRWCRVEDVLRWADYGGTFEDMGVMVSALSNINGCSNGVLTIPCDQYTASVIMRASENLRDKGWTTCFYRDKKEECCAFISFWSFNVGDWHMGNVAIPLCPDPDPTQYIDQWDRDWVETVLKGME
jgi:hypothetical protein